MRQFFTRRGGRRRLAVLVVGLAALAGSASVAVGGLSSTPDGGPGDGAAGTATARTLVETRCGPDVGEVVRTENTARSTTSNAFATIPGMSVVVSVPSGQTRCIKVLFTAEAACSGNAGAADDFCYVRALDNGVVMQPDGANFQALSSEDATAEAHAYEWVRRVGAGNHTIAIQWRADGGGTSFFLDDVTMDVKVTT